jgi:hypothetical protein
MVWAGVQLVRERSFYHRSNPKLDFQFFNPYHRACFKRDRHRWHRRFGHCRDGRPSF